MQVIDTGTDTVVDEIPLAAIGIAIGLVPWVERHASVGPCMLSAAAPAVRAPPAPERHLARAVRARLSCFMALESDPVIEAYKRDVDRTLIRENLQRSHEERFRRLIELQRFAAELRRAGSQRPTS